MCESRQSNVESVDHLPGRTKSGEAIDNFIRHENEAKRGEVQGAMGLIYALVTFQFELSQREIISRCQNEDEQAKNSLMSRTSTPFLHRM